MPTDLINYLATGLLDAYTTTDPIMRDAKLAMWENVNNTLNGKDITTNDNYSTIFKSNR